MQGLSETLKSVLPQPILRILTQQKKIFVNAFYVLKYSIRRLKQFKALQKVRKKESINAVFFVIHHTAWKYDYVYQLLEKDPRYKLTIILCPFIKYGEEFTMRTIDKAYEFFLNKGYNVLSTYQKDTGDWLDVKNTIKPDIVFFTNPYTITKPQYLIANFQDTLTCYVPYGFKNSYLNQLHFNQLTQRYVWKFFVETKIHQQLAKEHSKSKGKNTVVTGYPGMDVFLIKDYHPVDIWKIKDKSIKRIIWAPHHTIPGDGVSLDFSTFLKYYCFMLDVAREYNDKIQIAFKPHPMLRENLNKLESWGKQKTDEYYETWNNLENGQLNEFEYTDLFMTSDAMIHDCGSFSVEYLYTGKPVMFLVNDEKITDRYNEIGKMAFEVLAHGRSNYDIKSFIEQTVIGDNDTMKGKRESFFNEYIKPPNGKTASENIVDHINHQIFKNL